MFGQAKEIGRVERRFEERSTTVLSQKSNEMVQGMSLGIGSLKVGQH